MAVTFSDEVMKAMGFRLFAAGETVRARFTHLTVFAIEGITVASTETATVPVKGHVCKLAIAPKVNAACRALLSDDYAADESEWEKEHKCSGPYALIAVGPTEEFEANAGRLKEEADGSVTTYDCFPTAKAALREVASEVLPELVTALTCNFFTPGRHFRARSVDVATCGTTPQGRTVHDLRITMSALAFASIAATSQTVQTGLVGVVSQVPKLNVKVARFFKLAMFEEDDLKRFLYFFLALEVKTHATFAAVDHSESLALLVPKASLAGQSVTALLQRHTDNMKNLRDRFVWCSLLAEVNHRRRYSRVQTA
ncbi:MAG: hypothetical protein IPK20_04975 [Betaproteobacteria bacterium]|nr:hypothetical protein [Betaproteobacteria bacterium]